MKHKILKYCYVFNIIILNIFAAGFILNFIAYSQTNWIKNDNYVYGIFQYCTANQIIRLDDSFSFYDQVEVIYRKYTSDNDIRCFKWSKYTTPKFIHLSFILQSAALVSHITLLVIIIILKMILYKINACYKNHRDKDKKVKFNVKERCCLKVSYHIAWNFFFCFIALGITAIYGVNLVLFQYHQNLTNIKINNESLSWCYWVAVGGSGATLVATIALFAYTIYFKMLNSGKNRKLKYSIRYFIDAYKKFNSPFYSMNLEEPFTQPPHHSSFVSRAIESINASSRIEAKSELVEQAQNNSPNVENAENPYDNAISTNANGNVFFRRNPEISSDSIKSDAKITHSSEIVESKKSLEISETDVKPKDDTIRKSSSSQQQPTSFIYSQVYPSGKKEKNAKDATLKMVVLPYGSLSGTCATTPTNNIETNDVENEIENPSTTPEKTEVVEENKIESEKPDAIVTEGTV